MNLCLDGLAIAVLHSAVRGMHVYHRFPPKNIFLKLAKDEKSIFRDSVGVFQDLSCTKLIGHVAAEHAKLLTRWLNSGGRVL